MRAGVEEEARGLIDRADLEQDANSEDELLRRRAPGRDRQREAWTAAALLLGAALLGVLGLHLRSGGRGAESIKESSGEAHWQQLDVAQSVFDDDYRPAHVLTFTTTTTPYGWVPPTTLTTMEAPTTTTAPTSPPTTVQTTKYAPLTFTTTSTTVTTTTVTTSTSTVTTKWAPLTFTVTTTNTGSTATRTSSTVTETITTTTTYPECAPGAKKDSVPVNWCNTPLKAYSNSSFVQEQCADRKRWKELSTRPTDTEDGCEIDPVTHQMKCERHQKCADEKIYNFVTAFRELTYACGAQCDGAVLINCCKTCSRYASTPWTLGMDKIICEGCEEDVLQKVADEVNCHTVDGQFECDDDAMCKIEAPPETCIAANVSCAVYECDACANQQLKASCCLQCLDKLCDADWPETRLLCQGCGGNPDGQSGGWWPFR